MQVDLEDVTPLRFPDGSPVRAASAIAPFGAGFLVVQDDATHAAWCTPDDVMAIRLLPAIGGLDTFEKHTGTKHLKPDLEAACPLEMDGRPAVLMMGSGSSIARMRWVLVVLEDGRPQVTVADMTGLYAAVAASLGVDADALNLEGACLVDGALRWFHRGLPSAGLPSGSVDLDLAQVLAAMAGRTSPEAVGVENPLFYDLGDVHGVGLAVTDAVTLPDGTVLLSAAAEDSPNVIDDGPVTGSALALLVDDVVTDVVALPLIDDRVAKVEGLMVVGTDRDTMLLRAVVDVDDHLAPSLALRLNVRPGVTRC
ncbi:MULTISPECIES: DUF6910 family protein [unclassified Nocardioides]|uniref:DUF6910 family protein n=1 Tax=unclassified Nocardioides TaxID=2615069 RepID=UPI0006F34462|nr:MULTISPECIES: hypothetical protein [unclassified Nocardioides]KRA38358.1 hypothetical protein ASD81_06885 [Nocardioides sp. Root614]KRA92317.1 hypothetical protein ASD84_07150 [Nocardioides sp. Root682]